ncbi:MAG: lipopolysaccharide biosynthesis protein [Saprospiraceae bacterium]
MGVIQRQSIKASIAAYIGVLLGAINTIFIYPMALSQMEIGLVQNIISKATILSSFLHLGAASLAIKYYPHFQKEAGSRRGYLMLILLFPTAGFLLALLLLLVFNSSYQAYLSLQTQKVAQYFYLILPLGFIMALNFVLTNYPKNFYRITVPTLLDQVAVKLGLAAMTILYYYHLVSQGTMLQGIALAYSIPAIGLVLYAYWHDHFSFRIPFNVLKPPLAKEMLVFTSFMWIGNISANIRNNLASATLNEFIGEGGLVSLSIFSVAFYIGTAIAIPGKSIEAILSSFTAKALLEEDYPGLKNLYQKAAKHQFMIGCFIFSIIIVCLPEIFAIMPNGEKFSPGAGAIVVLGLGSLVDLATGINSQILSLSKYYKYDLVFAILMGLMNFILLYFLVKVLRFNIMGAAWANFLALLFFNILKLIFIYRRMHMLPFTAAMGAIIPIALLAGTLTYFLPDIWHPLFDIAIKSFLFALIFFYLVYRFRLSEELNSLFEKSLVRIKNSFRK